MHTALFPSFRLKFIGMVLVPLLLVGGWSCKGEMGSLGIKLDAEQETLSNGLRVVMVEDHTVPVIAYQTWYKVGSVDERPGATGIAHLFEHLMFKGTAKYGPKAFFLQLEAKGADVNAFTTRDYTVYHETFSSSGVKSGGVSLLEKAIDMESDRMANLQLDEEALKTEVQVVLEERRLRTDNSPSGRMQEALWQLAYRKHPYQWPVIGYPEDLLNITVQQLKDFFAAHYQPSNAILVVVGDFDRKKTLELIKKAYGGIPKHERPKREIPKEPEQNEERRLTLYDQVASERFSQAYHVTSAKDDDSYALDVLANILFEGTSSRAYRRLVEDANLAQGVSGSAFTPAHPGLFVISASMRGGVKSAEAEKVLEQVIREVQEHGVSDAEIKVAVRQMTVQLVDSVRTPHGLAELIGTVMTIFGEPERFANDLQKYFKVSADDVKRVASEYLIPNNRSVVTLVPESQRKGK